MFASIPSTFHLDSLHNDAHPPSYQTHPPTQTNSLHWGETSTLKHILKPAPPNITQFYVHASLWVLQKNTCSTTTSLTEIRQTMLGPLSVLAERGSLGTMVRVFWFQISMQYEVENHAYLLWWGRDNCWGKRMLLRGRGEPGWAEDSFLTAEDHIQTPNTPPAGYI